MSKKKRVSLTSEQASVIQSSFRQGGVCSDVAGNFFLPDGQPVNPRTVRALIEAGYLIPNHDGMFGTSQTYKPNLV